MRAWTVYLTGSVALFLAYAFAMVLRAPDVVLTVLYVVVVACGVIATVVGIRLHRPSSWWPWLLLLGQILSVIALFMPQSTQTGSALRSIGPVDAFYLAEYPIGALVMLSVLRRRSPGRDLPTVLDAAVVTVSAGMLSWIYIIAPVLGVQAHLGTRAVLVAYPLGDLLLAALGARLLLSPGPQPVAGRFLAGFQAASIVPDTVSLLLNLTGRDLDAGVLGLMWMAVIPAVGLAVLHPSMLSLEIPAPRATSDLSPLRLTILACAALLAPATLLVQYLRGAPLHVPVICAACAVIVLLVIARLAGVVAVQHRMAITDGLTGLRTRRHFQEALAAQRRSVAVVLLDIDHFKRVNDTYGHDGGDRVLREVADRLSATVRPGDVVARYGGEEFAILLPDATAEEARAVAARVHEAVRATPIPVGPDTAITVTISVGVACGASGSCDALPLLADRLLYDAKEAGRDRVHQ